jgi:hypothetical protein
MMTVLCSELIDSIRTLEINNKIIAIICKTDCFYNLIMGAKETIIQCKKMTEMALTFKANGAE